MSDNRKDIFLLGEPKPGVDRPALVRNLAAAFKKDVPSIEKMLRRPRSLIKADIDQTLAAKYQAIIEKAGGQCLIVDHAEPLFPAEALQPSAARTTSALAIDNNPASYGGSVAAASSSALSLSPVAESAAVSASPYVAPTSHVVNSANHYCYQCGTAMPIGTAVCPSCHTEQLMLVEKSKVTAGFLAFFLGGLGVHRFYLGQWWGIFYVLFWLTGIPSFISAVEAFVFWFTSKENWLRRYGRVPKSRASFALLLVVALVAFVAIIGILAAIALPAYQDYTTRAKVQSALPLIDSTRHKVSDVIVKTNFLPSENIMAGLPDNISGESVASIRLMEGAQMEVTFAIPSLRDQGNTIIWTPKVQGTQVIWACKTGSMPDKYRPRECRDGVVSPSSVSSNSTSLTTRLQSDDKTLSIRVPSTWKSNRQLSDAAVIGAARPSAELYTIVIAEAKVDFEETFTLADYTELIRSSMEKNVQDLQMDGEITALKVNGLPAQRMILFGTVDGVKIAYVYTLVESETGFYQVLGWTLRSRLPSNLPLLTQVTETFTVAPSP